MNLIRPVLIGSSISMQPSQPPSPTQSWKASLTKPATKGYSGPVDDEY